MQHANSKGRTKYLSIKQKLQAGDTLVTLFIQELYHYLPQQLVSYFN